MVAKVTGVSTLHIRASTLYIRLRCRNASGDFTLKILATHKLNRVCNMLSHRIAKTIVCRSEKYLQVAHVLHLEVVVVEHRVGVGTCRCRRSCWCRETRMHRYPITHVCYDLIVGLLIASIILCRVSQWKATPFPMH